MLNIFVGYTIVITLLIFCSCCCVDIRVLLVGIFGAICVAIAQSNTPTARAPITGGGSDKSLSIFDPRFNMREIAKHLILLEDHLFHKNKHCIDCISKHFLTIEAFAEETRTLDKLFEYEDEVQQILQIKSIIPPLIAKMKKKTATPKEFSSVAQSLRQIRKPLAVKYGYIV
jgi:hypothetical protein